MKIIHATSECVPYAKTGGLGDVVPSLSKALAKRGHDVYIFLPRYGIINLKGLELLKDSIPLHFGGEETIFDLYREITPEGVHVIFIDYPPLFDRPGIYGADGKDFEDNAVRYLYFARAVIEGSQALNLNPDVFHCHDWQSSFIPTLLRNYDVYNNSLKTMPVLLTIHNLSFQGLFKPAEIWKYTYLDYSSLFHMEGLEFFGKVNFLKGGILFSSIITTVSPSYSKEIQEEEQGCGLEGLLKKRSDVLYGVLNGVDDKVWNPEIDTLIPHNYSCQDLSGKVECKRELMKQCGFKDKEDLPIIGIITRLTPQKGLDLILESMEALKVIPFRLAILGTGLKEYEDALFDWSIKMPDKLHLRIEFNEAFAHLIEAGSDLFLMPSRYEPCGLNQMYSLKYGTIPIVRHTGGLADTVTDFTADPSNATGFKFYEYSRLGLLSAIDLSLSTFSHKDIWKEMIVRGMKQDFSWNKAADTYLELYVKANHLMRG